MNNIPNHFIEIHQKFLARDDAGDPPFEFQLFPYGVVSVNKGPVFIVDEPAMEDVIAYFKDRGIEMVIDYEHQTENGEEAPAAGWVENIEARGEDGLWLTGITWTERAADYIQRREYRYFSPVFGINNDTYRLAEVNRVALTNAPRLNHIRPLVAKDGATTRIGGKQPMSFLTKTIEILGLAANTTEDQAVEAITALKNRQDQKPEVIACKEILDVLDLPKSASRSEVIASINIHKNKPDMSAEVTALKQRLDETERDKVVAKALKAGKITPAQKDWADQYALKDLDGFKIYVDKAPVVVPLEELKAKDGHPGGEPNGGIDDGQVKINDMMGVTGEAWQKFGSR
jgi:phage I-like protein